MLFALAGTLTVMLAISLLSVGCEKEPYKPDVQTVDSLLLKALRMQDCDTFKLMVENLAIVDQSGINLGLSDTPSSTPIETTENYIHCTQQDFHAEAGYSELAAMDPTTSVIYPGCLVDGDTWSSGAYRTLIGKRKAVYISTSAPTNGSPKELVEHPEQISSYREAYNKLIDRTTIGVPADVKFDVQEVYSQGQANMLAGAHFSGWGVKVSASYNEGSSTTKSRVLVRFIQKYYSIDLDDPEQPCELFDTLPDLSGFGRSPLYISSVVYGRIAYFMAESTEKMDSLKWAINASYNGTIAGGGGNVESRALNILKNSSIKGFIIGGDGDAAVKTINGFEDFKNYVDGGGNPSKSSPGAPISYTMKFLKNREVAKVKLTSDYTVRNCEVIGQEIEITPANIDYFDCGEKQVGDTEFDGHGPKIDGTFALTCENSRDVYLQVLVTWKETAGDLSTAQVDRKYLIWTAPPGKTVANFMENTEVKFSYTDDSTGVPDMPQTTGGSFIDNLRVVGDTDGGDMSCNGDKDCNVRFKLKPFKVSIK